MTKEQLEAENFIMDNYYHLFLSEKSSRVDIIDALVDFAQKKLKEKQNEAVSDGFFDRMDIVYPQNK